MRGYIGAAASAWGIAAVFSCLPDLGIQPPPPFCGDGFVDPDAGEECEPVAGDVKYQECVDCKVSCLVGAYSSFEDPATKHCYFQTGPAPTSGDAIDSCQAWGGHVVRFVGEAELRLVAPKAASEPFWIGINRSDTAGVWRPSEPTPEPGWSATCAGCFAQIDGVTIPPDPTQGDAAQPCVAGTRDAAASWTESICSSKKAFSRQTICEREPTGSRARGCGDGGVCFTVAATQAFERYVLVGAGTADAGAGDGGGPDGTGDAGALGADDAVAACAGLGGRLAVLHSREEREQVGHEISLYFGRRMSAWIGLSDSDGTWGWDLPDAGGTSPPPWGIDEPAAIGTSEGRAFVLVDPAQADSELAHAASASGDAGPSYAALCQVP